MPKKLFFGVMTGTSADGIDIVLSSINSTSTDIIDSESTDFSENIKAEIKALCLPSSNELFRAHTLGIELSILTAKIINSILARNSLTPCDISAIGFHGQTIRHHPDTNPAFSIQIGCPSTLSHHTKISTITDFRMADIAAGGQGAPLVPAFHKAVFHSSNENRIILNIGGIANITYLPAQSDTRLSGFDTGPGNTLLDEWVYKTLQKSYDAEGEWAKCGDIIPSLLESMMSDEYITKPQPKSTGKEHFNLHWLTQRLKPYKNLKPEDIQRTLTEFTCQSIYSGINTIIKDSNSSLPYHLYLCGGGINNTFMRKRLSQLNPEIKISSTIDLGVHPQQVEACAFSWLASKTYASEYGNLKEATGASEDKILGGTYPP